MLNQGISLFCQTAVGLIFGYALDMILTKKPGSRRWLRIVYWIAVFFAVSVNRVSRGAGLAVFAVSWGLTAVFVMISFRYFYGGSVIHRLEVFATLLAALCVVECGVTLALRDFMPMDYHRAEVMLGSLMGSVIANIALYVAVALWRRVEKSGRMPRGAWICVLMSVCILVPTMQNYVQIGETGVSPVQLSLMLAALLFNLLMICVQFNQAEKNALEHILEELRFQTELQRQHYRDVEARREEMAKLRHDYNNFLTSVLGLLHMGRREEACQAITSLLNRVDEMLSENGENEA